MRKREIYDKALEFVDRVISANPRDPPSWHIRSAILHKMGREDEAKKCIAMGKELLRG